MTSRKPLGLSWESFVERQICEAQQAGQFDDLPGFGKPLPDLGEPGDEFWWIRRKLRQENLSLTPPGLAILKDIETTLAAIWTLQQEVQVREAVEALNQRIAAANRASAWGPASTAMPLEVEPFIERWRERRQRESPNEDQRLTPGGGTAYRERVGVHGEYVERATGSDGFAAPISPRSSS